MTLPAPLLASSLGWATGLLAAVVLLYVGTRVLRALARRQVPWWGSVAGLLLAGGPALGLLIVCAVDGLPLLWGAGAEHNLADVAWSLLLFFGVGAALRLTKDFLTSPFVSQRLGWKPPDLVLDAVRYVLLLITLFVIVSVVWGRPDLLTALFTASAVGTVILGFALQETLANFFAGMSLVSEQAYALGDWVWVGDTEGQVVGISRRATRLRTRLGDVVTLSNRAVASSALRNLSKPTPLHAEMLEVSAPSEVPPNRVREVLRRAMEDVEGVLSVPVPLVRLLRFDASSIDYQVKIWLTAIEDMPDIKSEAMVQIWYHLRRAGIDLPYPVVEHRPLARLGEKALLAAEAMRARLSSASLFQALPPEALEVLARGSHSAEFAVGERIVRQGAPGRSCFVVDQGRVAVTVEEAGSTRVVATLGPGELFGEMSLLTGQDRAATVRAQTDARLVEVDAPALREALHLAPELATTLARVMAERKEGISSARAALTAEAAERLRASTQHLGGLIRQFFRMPAPPKSPP